MSRMTQAMLDSLPQSEPPRWSRRKLLTLAMLAAMVALLLPVALHLLLPTLLTLSHPIRVTLASLVLAATLVSLVLMLSWLTLALARSIRNL